MDGPEGPKKKTVKTGEQLRGGSFDMLDFNIPPFVGKEFEYMREAVNNKKICGDGPFTKKCNAWLEERFGTPKAMLTTSG